MRTLARYEQDVRDHRRTGVSGHFQRICAGMFLTSTFSCSLAYLQSDTVQQYHMLRPRKIERKCSWKSPDQYAALTIPLPRPLDLLGAASDVRVGFLRVFLSSMMTLSCKATICNTSELSHVRSRSAYDVFIVAEAERVLHDRILVPGEKIRYTQTVKLIHTA